MNYVELEQSSYRHVLGRVFNGKNKSGGKQALTQCGLPVAVDDVVIYASPTSSLMGKDDARPPCPACHGKDEAPEPQTAAPPAPNEERKSMTTTVVDLELGKIKPSPFNHRRAFRDMEQLAESIKARGVLQPVTVRPANGDGRYELVFGERRWRASQLAGAARIPAIVREMTDVEVLEAQLIENVQRSDVHALEEADGYKELLDKHGYDVDRIAAKTGKSKAYVYARLKLCALAPGPRKAFLEDRLNPSVALLIARIPDAKLQQQALEDVLTPSGWQNKLEIEDDKGKVRSETLPLHVRSAQVHIQQKYMLRLELAPFDTTDATLDPKVGACTACPHRSGNQRELFSDVKSADVCTNPPCFETKKAADWDRKSAAAVRAGQRVLAEKETKNVFEQYHDGVKVQHGSPYVDPNDRVPYELDPSGKKTWKSLLGKSTPATVVAKDGAGSARTLWDKKSAIATATKSGAIKEAKAHAKASSSAGRGDNAWREKQKKMQAEAKRRSAIATAAFAKLADTNHAEAAGEKYYRWLACAVVEMLDAEDIRAFLKRRGVDAAFGYSNKATAKARAVVRDEASARLPGLVVELVASYHANTFHSGFGDNLRSACELFKVDLKKLGAELAAAEKAKAKAKKPAKKAAAK